MTMIQSHRDLIAWQQAFSLGIAVHRATRSFPKEELYGLTSQLRRSAVSIASNIAEGYGRQSTQEYIRFLQIARGSLYEVDTQLQFALEFEYVDEVVHSAMQTRVDEAGRVLAGLIRSINASTTSP
jgi:four helix bundle protein